MFCASWDDLRNSGFLRMVSSSNTKVFLHGFSVHYAGKADLSRGCWNPKRKLGITRHFSEIIELTFGRKMPYIVLYFKAFLQLRLLNYP